MNQAQREKIRQMKATFDECVQAVMDDPHFEPQGDRSPEESARAICATKPGGPQEGKSQDAATALLEGDVERLPERGRRIFDSMHRSSMRFFARTRGIEAAKAAEDQGLEAYARGIAWRAVAEAYGYDREPTPSAGAGKAQRGAAELAPATKYAPSGAAGLQGDSVIVPIALNWRGDLARWYDRTFTRDVPNSGGVKLFLGQERMKGANTLIYALVPRAVAGSMPGGIGATDWVRRNMALLYQIGRAEHASSVLTTADSYVKRAGGTLIEVPATKFLTSPSQAKRRITYGIVYPSWEVDLQGQYATSEQVERMAHGFMENGGRVKLMHRQTEMSDGKPPGVMVESFVAREGDRDFPAEAWVGATQWHPEVWPDVVAKRLRGYSIGGEWSVAPLHLVSMPREEVTL